MDEATYREISKQWRGVIYQGWPNPKYKKVTRHIDVFQGKRVLDIGCNAGVITYDIAQCAAEWVGLEKDQGFFEQAEITGRYIGTPGRFVHMSLAQFLEHGDFDYNALYGSHVLYHLQHSELDAIQKVMMPRCDVVAFIASFSRQRRDKFSQAEYIETWIQDGGMRTEVRDRDRKWATVIGWRMK